MLSRTLQLSNNNSFLLFGARGVGKSTLVRNSFNFELTTTNDSGDVVTVQMHEIRRFEASRTK